MRRARVIESLLMMIKRAGREGAIIRVAIFLGAAAYPFAFLGCAALGMYAGLIQLHLFGAAAPYPSVPQERAAWITCLFLSAVLSYLVFAVVVRFGRKVAPPKNLT